MESVTDHTSLINAMGGQTAVANEIPDCTPGRVQQWKRTGRIPPEYWAAIVPIAHSKGLEFVSNDWLVDNLRPRQMPTADSSAEDAAA